MWRRICQDTQQLGAFNTRANVTLTRALFTSVGREVKDKAGTQDTPEHTPAAGAECLGHPSFTDKPRKSLEPLGTVCLSWAPTQESSQIFTYLTSETETERETETTSIH